MPSQEDLLESFNNAVHHQLNQISNSDHFSKIRMAFNEKCPRETKKCTLSSCSIPQMEFGGKSGYIDLSTIVESYSPTSRSAAEIWKGIYSVVENNENAQKLVSGLHFSVTTHLASKYTNIFNFYFSNPLIFKTRYRDEYKENFLYLYIVVRKALAMLESNKGEITEPTKLLSTRVRQLLKREDEMKKDENIFSAYNGGERSLLNSNKVKDVEIADKDEPLESNGSSDLLNTLSTGFPSIGIETVKILNDIVKQVACLECSKCKLWGTIQVKGLKSAIKVLNGEPLFKNEVIFLINLFRQLSITMIESRRLLKIRFPTLYIFIIFHRQILMLTMTLLGLGLLVARTRKLKHIKLE